MDHTLIYCYDAYCGWCYGFSKTIRHLSENYRDRCSIEVLSGGMILPGKPVHISATASFIRQSYPKVETLSGARFGADFLWHINNPDESDWYPDSLKPAVALCIFKEYFPAKQVLLATQIEEALFNDGRDLCDDEAYRHLLKEHGISPIDFYQKLASDEYRDKARYEFALVKQLKVTGFPCLLLQVSDLRFYLVASGYTDYDIIRQRLDEILATAS